MMLEHKQTHALVIDPQAVMSGFCWVYTDALLRKLKSLQEEGRLYKNNSLTEIGWTVVEQLGKQIGEIYCGQHDHSRKEWIEAIVATTEEFLAAFKK